MKKWMKALLTFALCLKMVVGGSLTVQAGTIATLSTTVTGGNIKITGTAETGTLACAVLVYDSTETTLLAMETCAVDADDSFTYTLADTYAAGTYVVKVADYSGGAYETATVTVGTVTPASTPVEEEEEEETAKEQTAVTVAATSPKTGDANPAGAWAVIMLAGMALMGTAAYKKSKRTIQ